MISYHLEFVDNTVVRTQTEGPNGKIIESTKEIFILKNKQAS